VRVTHGLPLSSHKVTRCPHDMSSRLSGIVRTYFTMEASLSKRSYAFVNHQQVSLVVVPTVFTTLAVAFTALRIYSRRLKKAKVLVDDYLCIAACVSSYQIKKPGT
jgi:hypothetical protein